MQAFLSLSVMALLVASPPLVCVWAQQGNQSMDEPLLQLAVQTVGTTITTRTTTTKTTCPRIRKSSNQSCPGGCWIADPQYVLPNGMNQCVSVGPGYYSPPNDDLRYVCPPATYSSGPNAQACTVCPSGTHGHEEGRTTICPQCPAGTYSGIPGSTYCIPCLTDFYNQDGANSASYRNGKLFCIYIDAADSEEYTPFPSVTTTTTTAPTRIRIAGDESPSDGPSQAPSDGPTQSHSARPSRSPSYVPTQNKEEEPWTDNTVSPTEIGTATVTRPFVGDTGHDGDDNNNEEETVSCDGNDTGHYLWHGHCQQCPSKLEATFYPFAIFVFLAILVTLLQCMVPTCFNVIVWCGIEFLQMTYLLGTSSISWPQTSTYVFDRVLPIFVLDVNAGFSLKCIMGVSSKTDQVWVLLVPAVVWICLFLLAKVSNGRLVPDHTVVRWVTIIVYVGHVKLILTSLEAMKCELFDTWMCSIISAIVGIIGLLVYGIGFPLWFLRALKSYLSFGASDEDAYDLERNIHQGQGFNPDDDNKAVSIIFHIMGVFPSLRRNMWWWPGIWMIRKTVIVLLLVISPKSPLSLLFAYSFIIVLTEAIQKRVSPLTPSAKTGVRCSTFLQKWCCATYVDPVLHLLLLALSGIAFLIESTKFARDGSPDMSPIGRWIVDILLLSILGSGTMYWIASTGYSCVTSSCPEGSSRFITRASSTVAIGSSNSINTNPQGSARGLVPAPPAPHRKPNNTMLDDEGNAFDDVTMEEEAWVNETTGLPVDPQSEKWKETETGNFVEYLYDNDGEIDSDSK